MIGNKGGVNAYLKTKNPNLYIMGCLCHSLHLCSAAASTKLPPHLKILLRNIYSYFSHSTKRLLEFKELQEIFNVKVNKLLRTSTTRWLSLEQVINK